jgi:hypothetical protein
MTDWQERAEKAEARVIELETLIQQYEEKLKLARLITLRDGDEGISPLASPVLSDKPPLTSRERPEVDGQRGDSPSATASTDPQQTGEPNL